MSKYRIVAADGLHPKGQRIFEEAGQFELETHKGLDEAALSTILKGCHGLIVRSATKVRKKVMEEADSLKLIGRAGIGTDNIDIEDATKNGIAVMNVPGANNLSVAEHAMGLIFALSRKISHADATMRERKWEKKLLEGVEVSGKTLGLVGLGRIGSLLAVIAKGCGMHVITTGRERTEQKSKEMDIPCVSFDELLGQSDVISIHTPLTDKTRGIFNLETFGKMKESAMLINTARGGIVEENDLAEALQSEFIGGAAMDVFLEEPLGDSRLRNCPNLIMTPHLGASTKEAQIRVSEMMARQFVEFFLRGETVNVINGI